MGFFFISRRHTSFFAISWGMRCLLWASTI